MLTRILFCTALAVGSSGAMVQAASAVVDGASPQTQAASADAQERAAASGPSAGKTGTAKKSRTTGRSGQTAAVSSKHQHVKPKLATAKAKHSAVPAKAVALSSPVAPSAGTRMKVAAKHVQGAAPMGPSGTPSPHMTTRFVGSSNEVALNHGPSEVFPTAISTEPVIPPGEAYARARLLDGERHTALAVPLYHDASRQGHGEASLRLMEIYSIGAEGVSRNYLAAVEFKRLAMQQGITIEYPPRR